MGTEEKNVALLGMSTLNGNKTNYYSAQYEDNSDKRDIFKGVSQLEPGTKFIINDLASKGKRIDKIIVLCTEKARNTFEKVYKKNIINYLKCSTDDEFQKISAEDKAYIREIVTKKYDGSRDEIKPKDNVEMLINKVYNEYCDNNNECETDAVEYERKKEKIEKKLNDNSKLSKKKKKKLKKKIKKLNKKILGLKENEYVKKNPEYNEKLMRDFITNEIMIQYVDDKNKKENLKVRYSEISSEENNSNEKIYEEIKELYKELNIEEMFKAVDININGGQHALDAIWEMANDIEEMRKEGNTINLYIDTQGGLRENVMMINEAVQMMTIRGVNVKKSVATIYDKDNIIHDIKDTTKTFRMYNLVSGMDEFIQYAKGDKFIEYYDNDEDNDEVKESNKNIANDIKAISDAISLSRVTPFYDAIKNLNKDIDNKLANSASEKKDLFGLFVADIKNSYEHLMVDGEPDTIKLIKWCRDKGLIQQAITIIEAKMPHEYVKDGVLYYLKAEDEKDKICKMLTENKIEDYRLNDIDHYFVKNYIVSVKDDDEKTLKKRLEVGKEKENIIKSVIKPLINQLNEEKFSIYSNVTNTDYLFQSLENYYDLSKERNYNNHAGEGSTINIIGLGKKIDDYVNGYERLKGNSSGKCNLFLTKEEIDNHRGKKNNLKKDFRDFINRADLEIFPKESKSKNRGVDDFFRDEKNIRFCNENDLNIEKLKVVFLSLYDWKNDLHSKDENEFKKENGVLYSIINDRKGNNIKMIKEGFESTWNWMSNSGVKKFCELFRD